MAYKSYEDLDIYKKAHKLAVEVHQMSLKLPKFEMYEEGSQIRRSSKSIESNIVEGFGRRKYKQEFLKFLICSLASCDETANHLRTLYETNSFGDESSYKYFCEEYDHLGKMINNFIKSVENSHNEYQESKNENQVSRIEDRV